MSFRRHSKYRNSGVEWLGELPDHWGVARLGNECETIVPMRDKPEHLDGDIPWVRIEDFNGKYVRESRSNQGVSAQTVAAMGLKVLPAGTVLCSCSCSMGATAIVASPLVTNQTFIGIHPIQNSFSSDYLYYLFQAGQEHLNSIGTGAIQTYLSRDDFRQLRVPKPPLAEQLRIAAFLDGETARIDALVAQQKRLIELLKEKREAVISHAVTKGLSADVPMRASGIEWLGDIPKHWDCALLSRIAERVVVGIAEAATHAYAMVGVPILRSTNIRPGTIIGDVLMIDPHFARERNSKRLSAGDLVTVRTGNAGVTAIIPPELDGCQCFTMLITTLESSSSSEYYCYWMNSLLAQRFFGVEGWGTAQTNISVPILKSLPVPIPPAKEQADIVMFLRSEVGRIDALVSEAEGAITLLRERRSALISAAVTGKIDVRHLADAEAA